MSEFAKEVLPVSLEEEMKQSYLDYAMSVIVGRALPDVRDGLKPVHRRVLYSMHELGNDWNKPYKKSARVVGDVIGKYHPHGDAAVYDTIVRMAQPFSMRYVLVDGQGNFGSVDGDPPAAMRYCVTADTLIATDRGLVPISAIGDPDQGVDQAVSLRVLSLDGKVQPASRWFDCGLHPTLMVETGHGFQIVGTDNHPLLTLAQGADGAPCLRWKRLDQLQEGDYVAIDRSSDALWPAEPLDLRGCHPKAGKCRAHTLPQRLDESLALVLGALTAEGTVTGERIEFTQVPGEFATAFETAWNACFPDCRFHRFERQAVGYGRLPFRQYQVVAGQVVAFLAAVGLEPVRSPERRVPGLILRSPKGVVAAFLRAYFEGDGSVERSGRSLLRVSAYSGSRRLLQEIQLLLLRFGIVASLRRSRTHHRLLITGRDNLARFAAEIGFLSQSKRRALAEVLDRHGGRALPRRDFVPYLADFVRRRAVRHRQWLAKHNVDRVQCFPLVQARLAEALPPADFARIAPFLAGRYLFDRVSAVLPAGWRRVYSLRVDSDCHAFWGNGFVNHNTEVRMARIAHELLVDLDKETVDFVPNYDESEREPEVLPAKLPNLLVNGSAGIAVGMATNIPPHNLAEVINGILALIDDPDIGIDELMRHIPGPDFPTGAIINGAKGIRQAYETGRGRIYLRACSHVETARDSGRQSIVVTELPYQVNKARLIEKIAALVKEGKLEGIAALRDESDKEGMRMVIELKHGEQPDVVLNNLYQHTQLQSVFGINMVALVDGRPRLLNLKEILEAFVDHRREVVTRRTLYELRKARERVHVLEGLAVALANIDVIIELIKSSPSPAEAKAALLARVWRPGVVQAYLERAGADRTRPEDMADMAEDYGLGGDGYRLSPAQAQAILDLRLHRLTGLEQDKIVQEYENLLARIDALLAILGSDQRLLEVIREELIALRDQFGDERRTEIYQEERGLSREDLISEEAVVVTLTHAGYTKAQPLSEYRAQRRGGRGKAAAATKEADFVEKLIVANTHDTLLCFSSQGKVYAFKVYELPMASRTSRGKPIVNLLPLEGDERVNAVLPVRDFSAGGSIFMATAAGVVKKTPLKEFDNLRSNGKIAIDLKPGDRLVKADLTDGGQAVMLFSSGGKAICFNESEVRSMGRTAGGVRGMKLPEGDRVIAMIIGTGGTVLTVTENGYGKRTRLDEFPRHRRGGQGVIAIQTSERNGKLVGAVLVHDDDEIMLITTGGTLVRTRVREIPVLGRNTQGVRIIRLGKGEKLIGVDRIEQWEEE